MRSIVNFFKGIYRLWMRFAHLLGTINRFVFLTVFYWVIIDIANVALRLRRADLLDRRMKPMPSYWHRREPKAHTYPHQF